MNTTSSSTAAADRGRTTVCPGRCARFVVQVGETQCEVRARAVALVADVLGFEDEMGDDAAILANADERVIVDALESRMIMPPRPRRRGGRPVSSRAVFFGVGG